MMNKIMKVFMTPGKMIDMFTLKVETSQNIDEIARQVPVKCAEFNFSLLKEYNYHEIVESKGFPIKRKVYIYEICQAKMAAQMLTDNPEFSIFMPCKLAIYENNGETIISTMNMEIMLKALSANPELFKEATSLFNTLKSMMNSLKK